MINLLPPDLKQGYHYAQHNSMLIRWVVICLFTIVGVGIIGAYGFLYMDHSINEYSNQVVTTQAELKQEKLAQTEAKVKDISNSLKLAVKVLSKEVLFSKLLKQIAATIPANANLTDLSINQVQGGIDITAVATDYNTATQVQVNLADPANKIFQKADIVNIDCSSKNAPNPHYPCTVQIRALFAQNNPFLFINNSGQGG